jgi:phosphopantetheine adenylyltransferase
MLEYFYPSLVQVGSDSLLNKARDFFKDPERRRQTLDINLNKAADRITTVMRVREKEGPAVAEYLKQF